MKKTSLPPILLVSGDEGFLRRRFIKNMFETQRAQGWVILEVDGSEPSSQQDVFQEDLFGEPKPTLVLVHNPEKMDLGFLEKYHQTKAHHVTLVLYVEGEIDGRSKFGKWAKASLTKVQKSFPTPSEWKSSEVASAFVQSEFEAAGLTIPSNLATALTQRSGTDLGVLSFEVMKIVILVKKDGVTVVSGKHIARGMAPISEASVLPISDALGAKDGKRLAKALSDLKRTSKGDQTMRITRMLGSSVVKWMQALYLDSLPPKAAAEELGVHPWVFETRILPAARRWGKKDTILLLRDLAESERAVLNGANQPWVVLTTRLLHACQ